MNGAHALLATLQANDVDVCFSNPGTSEMHFVAALDDAPSMRGILCLFEGVATGAADGYARVARKPAATLLHLGPGLGNGWANLHNARRARVPLLNIVGDHATYHSVYDAPLESNIESVAEGLEGWYRKSMRPNDVASDAADAITASFGPPAQIATLVLPADVSWSDIDNEPSTWPTATHPSPTPIDELVLQQSIAALRSKKCALLVGGDALTASTLALAQRVATACDAKLLMETFASSIDRGAGVASAERLIYLSEFAVSQLAAYEVIIHIGAREPVGFFAYPNVPSELWAKDAELIYLAPPGSDVASALQALVDEYKAPALELVQGEIVVAPTGPLTSKSFAAAIGATMPEDLIVVDESNTSGIYLFGETQFSPPHQWLSLTGGAIGYGLPAALGAAVAGKRRVLALESDGSMMYTVQALWTMAREGLDVTVVGLSNRSYAVLNMELTRVGAVREGAASAHMLDLDEPTLDLAALASAQGVPSVRVSTADELVAALLRSYATPGPMFIEAMLPKGMS